MKAPKPGQIVYEPTKQEALNLVLQEPEKAAELLVQLSRTVNALALQVSQLTSRIEELERQLSQNSSNSSKPPSSDGYKKPSPRSLRKKAGKKKGGQKGHQGNTLKMVAVPDEVILHEPDVCSCGRSVRSGVIVAEQRRQVFDVPKISLHVTEHRIRTTICSCGTIHTGVFPDGVNAPVQYGTRVKAAGTYLHQYHHLPYERTCEAMSDLLGCALSPGTLKNIMSECHKKLEGAAKDIQDHITHSSVAHFDETGLRVAGKNYWVHSASTHKATYYYAHQRRGSEGSESAGILPVFNGTAVHDGWKPYIGFDCNHGLCNAHHLRELIFITEAYKQPWALEMVNLLRSIKKTVDAAKRDGLHQLPDSILQDLKNNYEHTLKKAYAANPYPEPEVPKKRGRPKKSKPLNLIERLDKQRDLVLRFAHDFTVPFDNNLAERDIRMVKLRQKVSGCFREPSGAEMFCRIRSYISTARKNGLDVIQALYNAFQSDPFSVGT